MFLKATVGEISSSSKLSGGLDRSRRVSCAGFCHARNSEVDNTLNFFIVFPFLQRLESEVQLMEETCKQTQQMWRQPSQLDPVLAVGVR